jgi:hypothetical protein
MKRIYFLFLASFLLISGVLKAQQNNGSNSRNIVESLATSDSLTNATAHVYQDKRIEQLVVNKRNSGNSKQATVSGYRVQVFSSNVQRSAKSDAFRIERQIREQFPEEMVYVNYVSPFWKVRVGDFRTQAQAQAFRSQLINSFPQMRSEIYIVREQISISGTK